MYSCLGRSVRSQSQRVSKVKKSKQDIITNSPSTADPKTNYFLPENLTDGNQDGFADEADFIRSFNNLVITYYQLIIIQLLKLLMQYIISL